MHPEKGPIVFTTQEQLFAHFAKEHAHLDDKANHLNFAQPQNESQSNDGQGGTNKESSSLSKRNESQYQPTSDCMGNASNKLVNDGVYQKGASSLSLIDSRNQPECSMPRIVVSTPPQLQHGCPVCHKVGNMKHNLNIKCNAFYTRCIECRTDKH